MTADHKYTIAAGVHVYVEIEFGMTEENTLQDVALMAKGMAVNEVGEALNARAGRVEGAALLTSRIRKGQARIDHIIVHHPKEEPAVASGLGVVTIGVPGDVEVLDYEARDPRPTVVRLGDTGPDEERE